MVDCRPSFQKTALYAFYASLVIILATFTLKGKLPIKKASFNFIHPNVYFSETRQPFAKILGGLRIARPQVEHFKQNLSIPKEEIGTVMNNHPESLSGAVAAHAVLRHHHYEIKPLVNSENTIIIQEEKKRGFPFPAFKDDNFLEHQRWLGPAFTFEILEDVVEKKVTLRPSQTASYAFSTRNRIQRTDSKSDPFLPRNQLGRDLLSEETTQLEKRMSEAVSIQNENLETSEDLKEITNTTVFGLAEMVSNGFNRSVLNEYRQSPFYYNALHIVSEDLALNLGLSATKRISKGESPFKGSQGAFYDMENKKLAVYLEDPEIIDKIGFCIKGLETGEEISQPGYKVTYTGDKSKNNLSSFGQSGPYNKQQSNRKAVAKRLAEINENYKEGSFNVSLSPEAVIERLLKLNKSTSNYKEPLEILTDIVKEAYNAPDKWESILKNSLKPEKKPLNLTYNTNIDSDHFLRKELRIALGQRLLNTDLPHDTGMSVELPIVVHAKKEKFTDFKEASDFTYSKGLKGHLTTVLKSIHQGLESCTESELEYVPVEEYKSAYTQCFNNKIREMDDKYSSVSESERLKIYHALIITNSEQQNLESFIEKFMGTSRIQEGEFGEYLTRNKNITADLFRKSSEEKVGFIKSLAEFSSVECKTILKRIEQKHVSMANTLFLEIEDMTHDLNQMEKETLLNPPSITRDLFHKHFSSQVFPVPESEKVQYLIENVSSEEIDQVLYNHAYCLGLTDIGNGYPRTVPVLKYHAQSKFLDDTSEKIVTKAIKKKTKKLTNLLKSNELIPHTGYKFPFAELLKACGVSPGLVDTVCYTERFTTFEKLSDALATGGLNGIQGVGFDKIRIIANFLAKYERAVKQNPTITAGAINSEMVNDVNIPSETVIDLNSESEIPNTVTLPHKSSIRSITTPVSSKPAQAVSKSKITRTQSENLSNRIEYSPKVNFLENRSSSS